MPPHSPIALLAPEYLESLPAPNRPLIPYTLDAPKNPPTALETPNSPDVSYTPSGSWVPTVPASPPIHP